MKKITLLAIAAVAISFASCKKDRTCTCTTTSTTSGGSTSTSSSSTSTRTLTKVSKTAGRVNCLSTKSTDTDEIGGTTYTTTQETTCTLS